MIKFRKFLNYQNYTKELLDIVYNRVPDLRGRIWWELEAAVRIKPWWYGVGDRVIYWRRDFYF